MRALVVASEVDQQKAAPLGLFVLVLLGLASYFLFKSMSRHLRHVRDDFPAAGYAPNGDAAPGGEPADRPGDGAGGVTMVGGLTRPAPVTLTRGRATEPRLIAPPAVGPRAIEPGAIDPRVDESRVVDTGFDNAQVVEPEPDNPDLNPR